MPSDRIRRSESACWGWKCNNIFQLRFTVPPVIHVPNQLVGAPLGTDVILECFVEASPMSINYWVKDPKGEMTHEMKFLIKNTIVVLCFIKDRCELHFNIMIFQHSVTFYLIIVFFQFIMLLYIHYVIILFIIFVNLIIDNISRWLQSLLLFRDLSVCR